MPSTIKFDFELKPVKLHFLFFNCETRVSFPLFPPSLSKLFLSPYLRPPPVVRRRRAIATPPDLVSHKPQRWRRRNSLRGWERREKQSKLQIWNFRGRDCGVESRWGTERLEEVVRRRYEWGRRWWWCFVVLVAASYGGWEFGFSLPPWDGLEMSPVHWTNGGGVGSSTIELSIPHLFLLLFFFSILFFPSLILASSCSFFILFFSILFSLFWFWHAPGPFLIFFFNFFSPFSILHCFCYLDFFFL